MDPSSTYKLPHIIYSVMYLLLFAEHLHTDLNS